MMKRPNKYDFDFSEDYESNLETYCDYLEKALDKACDVIVELNDCTNLSSEKYGHCPFEKKCNNGLWHAQNCISNKENWKEWCMKDV